MKDYEGVMMRVSCDRGGGGCDGAAMIGDLMGNYSMMRA